MATDAGAYLDSSALVKLIADEAETAALRAHVATCGWVASCELALAEVPRAVDRKRTGLRAEERRGLRDNLDILLAQLDLLPVERAILEAAGALPGAWLRTLDAIHVTAALTVAEGLGSFVTYDARQAEAAAAHELPVLAPGR